jgi:uncharacterized protein (UPF0335 family)
VNDGELQQFVRQIESLNSEIKSLNTDKSEIYKAAKFQGFDVKVLRQVIAERAKPAHERAERDEVFRLYWQAIEGARVPAEVSL